MSVASRQTVLGARGANLLGGFVYGGGDVTGRCDTIARIIDFGYLFENGSPCLLHRLASWSSPVNGFAGAMVR